VDVLLMMAMMMTTKTMLMLDQRIVIVDFPPEP